MITDNIGLSQYIELIFIIGSSEMTNPIKANSEKMQNFLELENMIEASGNAQSLLASNMLDTLICAWLGSYPSVYTDFVRRFCSLRGLVGNAPSLLD